MASKERTFEPAPLAIADARQFVRVALRCWGFESVDSAILVVSELATNAVRHSRGRFDLRLEQQDRSVLIQVSDGSPEPLEAVMPQPDAESGRGLAIVERVARQWGTRSDAGGGKTVWAEVAL